MQGELQKSALFSKDSLVKYLARLKNGVYWASL